jgi:tRNA threonylcarbamoyladenosine biosynthesis protein TsaE
MLQNEFITASSIQTKKLGALLAQELRGGEILCLSGELGAGKTTFTQGLLQGLRIKGPHTSPTFNILKEYKRTAAKKKLATVFHIDAYRIAAKDLLELGWRDFAGKPDSIVILEWAERVQKVIPPPPAGGALWISFEWISDKERKITLSGKKDH